MSGSFEREYERLWTAEVRGASGQRLELLKKDAAGTKKMLEVAVWPVRNSLEGIRLELELVSRSGTRIYIDAFDTWVGLALESEGFGVHAETITRDRFDFEKIRVRTMGAYRYFYVPFTRDQLEKKPEECRSSYAELFATHSTFGFDIYKEFTLYEREVLRYAKYLHRPIRPLDACHCLGCGNDFARKVLQSLVTKKWMAPAGKGVHRCRQYILEDQAFRLPL